MESGTISQSINMLWGIFQRNGLLPEHFAISLIPLTIVLTKAKPRYSRKNKLKINIFYMVGLKIYAWNGTELEIFGERTQGL